MELNGHWGIHTILDITECTDRIAERDTIEQYVKTLCDDILDMKRFGEPTIERFGDGDKYGYTLVQLIYTSSITAHFAEDTGSMYIDIFSCKPYNPDAVSDYTIQTFGGKIVAKEVIYRG